MQMSSAVKELIDPLQGRDCPRALPSRRPAAPLPLHFCKPEHSCRSECHLPVVRDSVLGHHNECYLWSYTEAASNHLHADDGGASSGGTITATPAPIDGSFFTVSCAPSKVLQVSAKFRLGVLCCGLHEDECRQFLSETCTAFCSISLHPGRC